MAIHCAPWPSDHPNSTKLLFFATKSHSLMEFRFTSFFVPTRPGRANRNSNLHNEQNNNWRLCDGEKKFQLKSLHIAGNVCGRVFSLFFLFSNLIAFTCVRRQTRRIRYLNRVCVCERHVPIRNHTHTVSLLKH